MKWYLIALCSAVSLVAQEIVIDESAMFSDTSSIIDSTKMVDNAQTDSLMEDKKSLALSGTISALGQVSEGRGRFVEGDRGDSALFRSGIIANAFLDARLTGGYKGFVNLEAGYEPAADSNKTVVSIREIFVDANIAHRAYFRAGKQVIQWGRCYFFNPTDLINVERKSFVEKVGSREGVFGLKGHVPFGTKANLYAFLDANDAKSPDSLAGAGKVEYLFGGTELAVAVWSRKNRNPVFGIDGSFPLGTLMGAFEATVSPNGGNKEVVRISGDTIYLEKKDGVVPKVALDLKKTFTVGEIKERLMVVGEFLYNGTGTDADLFSDTKEYRFADPVRVSSLPTGTIDRGSAKLFYLGHNLYSFSEYGRYYAGFFSSFNRFIVQDMSIHLNGLVNCDDGSAMITGGISYLNLHDLSLGLDLTGFVGKAEREFTMSIPGTEYANGLDIRITAGISF